METPPALARVSTSEVTRLCLWRYPQGMRGRKAAHYSRCARWPRAGCRCAPCTKPVGVQAAAACREAVGPRMDRHFRASLFLRFARDARGAIPLLSFFHYVMRRNALLQTARTTCTTFACKQRVNPHDNARSVPRSAFT